MKKYISMIAVYLLVFSLFLGGTYGGSHLIMVMAQSQPLEREHILIIDAGHGGEDGGATSCTGLLESTINLEIALRLDEMFRLLGWKTVMTRREDISIYTKGETLAQKKVSDLKERVRIVNETEDGFLISIHQNQFQESRYHGAQVFYNRNDNAQELAKQLQSELIRSVNVGSNRQAKQASGIFLMEHIERPGILIECGFLSNPTEEARLRSPNYQKHLCCVIATAVTKYLSNT